MCIVVYGVGCTKVGHEGSVQFSKWLLMISILLMFVFVHECFVCVHISTSHVYHAHGGLKRALAHLKLEFYKVVQILCGCRELNASPLQEQRGL